jgi:hypothetical protein
MTMAQSFANAGPRDHRCHEGAGSSGTRAKAPLGSSTSVVGSLANLELVDQLE